MNCALWLNQRKVYSAEEICENLDLASLCGYFCAGSLIEWLKSHNGEKYAAQLEKISPKDPKLKEKMEKIFGGQPVLYKQLQSAAEPLDKSFSQNAGSRFSAPLEVIGSGQAGLGLAGSRQVSSGQIGLGQIGSGQLSSGKVGSWQFGSWLSVFEQFGSGGAYGLFSSYFYRSRWLKIGSFSGGFEWEWEWERFLAGYGSFYNTSFVFGSGKMFYGSFLSAFRAYLMKKYGSRGGFSLGSRGSFNESFLPEISDIPDSDEYDRILMECVFGCRLNGYGYGIHNI